MIRSLGRDMNDPISHLNERDLKDMKIMLKKLRVTTYTNNMQLSSRYHNHKNIEIAKFVSLEIITCYFWEFSQIVVYFV